MLDTRTIPTILETDDVPKKKLEKFYKVPTPELIAYLDFSVSTTGVLSGVKVSQALNDSLWLWQNDFWLVFFFFRPSRKVERRSGVLNTVSCYSISGS